MPQGATLRVDGYSQFLKAISMADRQTKRMVRDEIRQAGEHVRGDATGLFAPTDARSAAGYRVVVRQRGVAVEQKYRRTTGLHREFGALQMRRALLPALYRNEERTVRAIEDAMDRIADRFSRG